MKIYVVNNMVPFLRGGAEALAEHLIEHLCRNGHDAQLVRIPFLYEPSERIYSKMLACRMMQLEEADLVIGLKFPAYLLPHANKVVWLVHQYRQAYDMWESGHSNIRSDESGERLRKSITRADSLCFSEVRRLSAISPVTQQRLKKFNGFDSELIRTPINSPELFDEGEYGDYVFCGGRINETKRQHLLVEAMRFTRSQCKLVVAGPADAPADETRLRMIVERHQLQDRVHLDIGFHPKEKIASLTSNALACAYLPIDEESLGYVSMEANQAAKAVLTCDDAGGILDLVFDGSTGWVCKADPREIAIRLDEIFQRRIRTIEIGMHAKTEWLAMGLTWEATIARLVA
ncbi:MAG: glycosyltransferase family 4 protein [Pirellula sp.]